MVDAELGLAVVFNGCIYNYHELRAELEATRLPVLLHQRHRGDPQGVPPVGRRLRRAPGRHVRLLPGRARQRAGRAGPRPPRHQAAVPGRGDRAAAVRLDAARAAGRRRGRHVDRPGGAAPLPDVPRGGAGAPDDPAGRAQAAAGHRAARSSPTAAAASAPTGAPSSAAGPSTTGWDAARLAGRHPRRAAHRRRAAHGGRRARRRAAVGRARLEPHRRPAGRGGRVRPADVQHRLRVARRHRGRRVPLLRRRWPSAFGTDHHRIRVPSDAAAAGARRRHRRHERADGQPRRASPSTCCRRRWRSTSRSCSPGQGADEVFAGYHWYPPMLGRRGRATAASTTYAEVFFDRPDDGHGRRRGRRPRWPPTTTPARRSSPRTSPGPGADARSTGRCASTPRSCWSTTRSSGSTT